VTSHIGSFLLRHLCLEIGRRGGARDTVLMTLVSSVHNPKIMLGMLVKVLGGDSIATRKRLPREGNVTFEDLRRVASDFDFLDRGAENIAERDSVTHQAQL